MLHNQNVIKINCYSRQVAGQAIYNALEVTLCRGTSERQGVLWQDTTVCTESQPLSTFRAQLDLIVGVSEINFREPVSTS